MSALFFDSSFLLLHLMITSIRLCAGACVVLQSHSNYSNTLSNLILGNISSVFPPATDSSAETGGKDGTTPREQILLVALIVCLIIYLIFTSVFVVIRRNALSASGSGQISVLPLHQVISEPPLSTGNVLPTPALPQRVHDPHEARYPPPLHSFPSGYTNVREVRNESHPSLAASETPTCWSAGTESDTATVVREYPPRRGF